MSISPTKRLMINEIEIDALKRLTDCRGVGFVENSGKSAILWCAGYVEGYCVFHECTAKKCYCWKLIANTEVCV